jgi:membrane protein insertase Oxa1/YidC/SpoIIIJ
MNFYLPQSPLKPEIQELQVKVKAMNRIIEDLQKNMDAMSALIQDLTKKT